METPFLLAADIDGTLLGDEAGEASLKALVESRPRQVYLALITGRSLATITPLIQAGRLPQPNYICADVGTELYDCYDPQNELGRRYAARASEHWSLETIYRLGVGKGVTIQDFPDGQPHYQAGFYWDGKAETLQAFRQRLAGLPGCFVLPSYDYYIDVLPASMGKGQAALFLQQVLGLDRQHVVVAGDTGNDSPMFETGLPGIVPANALDELKRVAVQPWHYHSPHPAGRGVLDGLQHFGLIDSTFAASDAGALK
ncbi:MAG TPA: HAD family hydrolase [Anaerolineales bacterium]|nr:HAD family hydrolase [Anaerolineales bacterium]